jgi:hypothetical protein
LSSLRWQEPLEGLEFGELFLGGIASIYFGHGHPSGYGFCFTNRRIIGFKMRWVSLALRAPFEAALLALYLIVLFETLSGTARLLGLLVPLLFPIADWTLSVLTRRISENIISQRAQDPSMLMIQKRDFEIRRNEIEEMSMKTPEIGSSFLGMSKGYLNIAPKAHRQEPTLITIYGRHRYPPYYQDLRDLVIDFSRREPKVKAMEYPSA